MNFYINGNPLNCAVTGVRGTVFPVIYGKFCFYFGITVNLCVILYILHMFYLVLTQLNIIKIFGIDSYVYTFN